jgi:dTDP-glucose 4,6-dehydratase
MPTVLVTGASGFVGHHVVEHILVNTDWNVIGTYTYQHRGDPWRLAHLVDNPRLTLLKLDCSAPWGRIGQSLYGKVDYVFNIASQSHVDRSIEDPVPFIQNNVNLALHTLEWARLAKPKLFLQFSTDEVYGPAFNGQLHAEWSSILPSNPYSASKAAQEDIAISYWRTYGVPLVITNTMNVIGERQDAEKFVPLLIDNIRNSNSVPIHASASGEPGSRFYIHARNVADALVFLVNYYKAGPPLYTEDLITSPSRYNIVGEKEVDNLTLSREVANILGKELDYHLVNFHSARPGHDRRYALDGTLLAEIGWTPPVDFYKSLRSTVNWHVRHDL